MRGILHNIQRQSRTMYTDRLYTSVFKWFGENKIFAGKRLYYVSKMFFFFKFKSVQSVTSVCDNTLKMTSNVKDKLNQFENRFIFSFAINKFRHFD